VSVYGTDICRPPPSAFLAGRLHATRVRVAPRSRTPVSTRVAPDLRGWTATSTRPLALRSRVPLGFNDRQTGPESSPACHRLRLWGLALGPASPCADCHGAGTLGLTVRRVFTSVCAYSFRHPHFPSLHPLVYTGASPHGERSPTPAQGRPSARPRFGGPLNPDHSRRIPAGLVSYYALFKGMAASKPTSQLSQQGHFLRYTQRPLRGLSGGSGFFPSRRWTLSLSDCLPGSIHRAFGVWLGLVRLLAARAHPVALPPSNIWALAPPRLYLNRFRGEPAISRLDWPFTPTHKSSERFSTHTGSGLHSVLPELHPAHG
jgi:hypothetical protein